jgi:ATP-dependent RNA helicase SUPV3L1/SUV3
MVNAEVTSGGELSFEGQIVGRLQGFRFTPETNGVEPVESQNGGIAGALAQEFEVRANRLSEAVDSALVLANDGAIRWLGDPVAKIAAGDKLLAPRALILADETLTETAQQKVQGRVDLWLAAYVRRLLGPLFELDAGAGLEGAAHNVAAQLVEALGVLERARVAHDVKALDQNARGMLRKLGVRFGAHYVYVPNLVKPAIRVLSTQLWTLRQSAAAVGAGLDEIPQLAASGRTSFLADAAISKETYRVAGFRLCGDRAVRVDIVERLADLIRPAIAYRPGPNAGAPPPGSADGDGFVVTGAMTSLTGCSGEQFASVLRSLGFVSQRVKGPALSVVHSAPAESSLEESVDNKEDAAVNPPNPAANGEGAASAVAESLTPATPDTDQLEAAAVVQNAPEIPEGGAEDSADTVGLTVEELIDDTVAQTAHESREVAAARTDQSEPGVAEPSQIGEAAQNEICLSEAPMDGPTAVLPDSPALEASAAPAEEALIEVWRPRPPNRQHRHSRPRDNNVAGRVKEISEGDSQPGGRNGVSERFRNRRRSTPPAAPQTATEADARPKEEGGGFRPGRAARRQYEPSHKIEGGDGRRPAPNKGRAPDERRQDERRHENASAPAPRREAPVNLNSPFAKLLALKSQLEAKGKN